MAITQLTDVIVPSVFDGYVQALTAQLSAFVESGVLAGDPRFDALLAGGGKSFDLPTWEDLADTESNVSSDAPGTSSTSLNITTHKETAIRQSRNQTWGAADLVAALAGADPLGAIAGRVGAYWTRQLERLLIASLQGVVSDNIANNGGDMVVNIARTTAGTVAAANLFNGSDFINAAQTMGEISERLVAVAMHSVVYAQAQKNNLIQYFLPSGTQVVIPTFQGKRVIVDDSLPAVLNATTSLIEYDTVLFGPGAFVRGVGRPRVPVEVFRNPLQGNGGGTETLTSRVEWIVHPRGFRFTSTSLAGSSPTNTELKAAANWARVAAERKQVPIAVLRSNG